MISLMSTRGLSRLTVVLALFLVSATLWSSAAQDKSKISYGMLLDSTGSMRSQFSTVLNVGKAIVHQTAAHGPVSIFKFASEGIGRGAKAVAVLQIERSQDEEMLNRTIESLYVEGGQTTLLDSVQFIADRMHEWSPEGDKIIVLVTDGEDRVSKVKQKDLIQQLKDRKIKVFAVGLVRELDSGKRSNATDLLKRLTKETGGRVVFPESNRVDLQSLLSDLAIPTQ